MNASAHCLHLELSASVNVARFEDNTLKYADVRIVCVNCGKPAVFQGLPVGVMPHRSDR